MLANFERLWFKGFHKQGNGGEFADLSSTTIGMTIMKAWRQWSITSRTPTNPMATVETEWQFAFFLERMCDSHIVNFKKSGEFIGGRQLSSGINYRNGNCLLDKQINYFTRQGISALESPLETTEGSCWLWVSDQRFWKAFAKNHNLWVTMYIQDILWILWIQSISAYFILNSPWCITV